MKHPWLDAHEITPGLWQGSIPVKGLVLKTAGFHSLIVCTKEYAPAVIDYPEVRVHYAPNKDGESAFTNEQLQVAMAAARVAVEEIREGRRVLVACMAGLNRSGLVTALTLHLLFGWPGARCVDQVRSKRVLRDSSKKALSNRAFVSALHELQPRQQTTAVSTFEATPSGLLLPRKS